MSTYLAAHPSPSLSTLYPQVLRGAVALHSLDVADNDLEAGAVAAIADALCAQPQLRRLCLARNIRTPPSGLSAGPPRTSPSSVGRPMGGHVRAGGKDDNETLIRLDDRTYDPRQPTSVAFVRCPTFSMDPFVEPPPPDDGGAAAEAHRAFGAIGELLSDPLCKLEALDVSGAAPGRCVPEQVPALLMSLSSCRSLTSADVSGHAAGRQPGVLGALLHLLRRPSQLRSLSIHQNGFDESSLQAVLGSWRWHNHTLQRLELFVAEASSAGGRTHSAPASHEIVQKHGAAAGRLVEAAEQLEQRNRRLMHAIMRSELPVPLGECSGPSHDS